MSVRIVRASVANAAGGDAGATPPRAPLPSFAATARRIFASEYQARLEGERIVAASRREADAILERARADARAIAERARSAGADAGKLEALAIVAAARADEAHTVDHALDAVVMATRAVAERAIGRALSLDDQALAGWAREALAPLRGARRIVVRGSTSSIERLRARLGELAPPGCEVLDLVADASLPEGTLVARSELGEVKVELATQVEAFAQVLRDALAPVVRGKHV